jgi:penicillin-binding protein-related factor A (putative recombinase)
MNDGLGKKAEHKIKDWLSRSEDGYLFERLPDQLSGFYGSKNICDFICYKKPYIYLIESKATWKDNFPFTMITEYQYESLLNRSKIDGVYGLVIVLFATYKRAFILKIQDIDALIQKGQKSLNIKKIDKWDIPYKEIKTVPSRKELLDYTGEIETYI